MDIDVRQAEALLDAEAEGQIDRSEFVRRAVLLGLVAGTGAGLAGEAFGATAPKSIRIGQALTQISLDPATSIGTEAPITDCVYDTLFCQLPGRSGPNAIKPLLVEKWGVSKGGRVLFFRLKQGVQFHGGYGELTAEDVKYSLERIAGIRGQVIYPNRNEVSTFQADWSQLSEVKLTGKYSGEIKMKIPFAPMFSVLASTSGMIVSRKAVFDRGAEFQTKPIGSGPYEFVSQTVNTNVVLRRFRRYSGAWQKHVKAFQWDEIKFVNTGSGAGSNVFLETAIKAGDVDVTSTGFSFGDFRSLKRLSSDKSLQTLVAANIGTQVMQMNVRHPNLRDIRVRKAVRHAIDYDALRKIAWENTAPRANAPITPAMTLGQWSAAPVHKYDRDLSKSLLKAAGKSKLTLEIFNGADAENPHLEALKAMCAQVGITLNIQSRAVSNDTAYRGNPSRCQLSYSFWWGATTPDPHPMFIYWKTDAALNKDGTQNADTYEWTFDRSFYAKYDQLVDTAAATLNLAKRQQAYVALQQAMEARVSRIWFAYPPSAAFARKGLKPVLGYGNIHILPKHTRSV
jgi:peptide/nickel transport system substrate-binding protein